MCANPPPFCYYQGHYFGNRGRDLFGEILVKFKAKGIKVIAYMVSSEFVCIIYAAPYLYAYDPSAG